MPHQLEIAKDMRCCSTIERNTPWQPVQRGCLVDEEPVLEAVLIQVGGCTQAGRPCADHQHSNLQQGQQREPQLGRQAVCDVACLHQSVCQPVATAATSPGIEDTSLQAACLAEACPLRSAPTPSRTAWGQLAGNIDSCLSCCLTS